ncbi:MAG TPA: hypothetical protein VKB92_13675 [Myxococcales bacterium]|nr:hypothetical protein [Myxococcales bacterium]
MATSIRKAALGAAGFLLFASTAALAARGALGGGLEQVVRAWETGDPQLSSMLRLHITAARAIRW